MPRPRNEALKRDIRLCAWQLFEEVGYHETSYTAIAEACSIKRNLVQYHFPKKERLAARYGSHLLRCAQDAWEYDDDSLLNHLERSYAVGVTLFTYLLKTDGRRRFFSDILESRSLTEDIIPFSIPWICAHMTNPHGQPFSHTEVEHLILETSFAFGGFYESIYMRLKNEHALDPAVALSPLMKAVAQKIGLPMSQVYHLTPEQSFDPFALSAAVRKMEQLREVRQAIHTPQL